MKQAFTDMIGNVALRERLRDDLQSGTLSHAYILEGAAGTGKHLLTSRIAAALSCERKNDPSAPLPCRECPSCRKILSGNSPDLILVNRQDKATLGVEAIRKLKTDVLIPPNDTDAKIYVIEDAHLMTQQAQNALLLTLEEPPSYVLFLLLCETVTPLLETIRSRAPVLRTEPIPRQMIGEYLTRETTEGKRLCAASPEEFSEILVSANGSIGRALALLDPKTRKPILAGRAAAKEFVRLLSERRNSTATAAFLLSLGQKRDEVIAQMNLTLLCLRDLLLSKQSEHPPLCFFPDPDDASSLAYGFSVPELLRYCEEIRKTVDALQQNANVRLTLTALAASTGLL